MLEDEDVYDKESGEPEDGFTADGAVRVTPFEKQLSQIWFYLNL